jgi:uncharacterized membrane protein YgcG
MKMKIPFAALCAALLQFTALAASTSAADASVAAGTWHFTGIDGQLISANAGIADRVQGTVTVAASGALAFSWDATANQTLPFATDGDAPTRVKNATTALAAGVSTATLHARAKLLKIDADTWVLQTFRLDKSGSTVTDGRAIAGVLHRNPLPTPDPAAWAKEFDANSSMLDAGRNSYWTQYDGAIVQTVKHGGSLWTTMDRAIVYTGGFDSDWDEGWDDSATATRNSDGSYTTKYQGVIINRTWWEGSTFYDTDYYDGEEDKIKWADGCWYEWLNNRWEVFESFNDDELFPDSDFYVRDGTYNRHIFDKTCVFQLPGNRIASVNLQDDSGDFNSTVAVESPIFGGGGITDNSGTGGGGGNNNNNTGGGDGGGGGGGGGGAPALPALALLAALLALRACKK